MGADEFMVTAQGETARGAFREAVRQAQYDRGHGGYTGTIAEKGEFKEVFPKPGETPQQCVDRHVEEDTFTDKWGPAGCVKMADKKWCFFGWASS